MGIDDVGISGQRGFPDTSFSAIVRARDPDAPEYRQHLGRLIERYWKPVYCVIWHSWTRDPQEAKDLTQDFFATVVLDRGLLASYYPELGSFRSLVRAALGNFMKVTRRDAGRIKRGGGIAILSLDDLGSDPADLALADPGQTPEQLFDAAWNEMVVRRAIDQLREHLTAAGKAATFEAFSRYEIDGERETLSYADLGATLGMTAGQVRNALAESRALLRQLVTEIVREYVVVDDTAGLAAELAHLLGA